MKYSLPQHLVSDSLACLVASRENVGGLVREQEWQEIRIQIIQIVSKARSRDPGKDCGLCPAEMEEGWGFQVKR